MSVPPEKLHELLKYCMDFAETMLKDSGDFYPFGAQIDLDERISVVGGYNGEERPAPQEIFKLLAESFRSAVEAGTVTAIALAANVNIPSEYQSPTPDGIRVHIESEDFSRFIYVPYRIKNKGIFKKHYQVQLFDPIAVQIKPGFFVATKNA